MDGTLIDVVWGGDADYVVYGHLNWPSRSYLMIPGSWLED